MSLYPMLARHVLAPAYDLARGSGTMGRLAQLERSQWWPPERIMEEQCLRLQRLIEHAYTHVPYYRELMDARGIGPSQIQTPQDLRQLPLLTRDEIRHNLPRLVSANIPQAALRPGWSGGTTGERLHFYSTREERLTCAYARWSLLAGWTGARVGDRHLSIREQADEVSDGMTRRLSLRLQQLTRINTRTVREENLSSLARTIQRVRPYSLFSYPSALALIAAYAVAHNLTFAPIPGICLGGEYATERQRETIRRAFGSEPFIFYGSNEMHEVAAQCEARDGLHIVANDFVLEVVDDAGHPLPPGQRGQLAITSLHNFGMPFIRYASGDIGTLRSAPCPCGRALPLLDRHIGRTRDYLVSPGGTRVAAMDLELEQLLPPDILQHQLVQIRPDGLLLRVVRAVGGDEPLQETQNRVASLLRARLGEPIGVTVELVDRLEMNLSGKRPRFVPLSLENDTHGKVRY